MQYRMRWGRVLGVAGLLMAAPVTLRPSAALAATPTAAGLVPFSTPLQRYTVAQPAYASPVTVAGPRPVSWLPPVAAAAPTYNAFPSAEAQLFSARGGIGTVLGLGLNSANLYLAVLTTVFGNSTLTVAQLVAPGQMIGYGTGYWVAGDGLRGVSAGLIGAGLCTLAHLVGYAVGTTVPRRPVSDGLFADTAPHFGNNYAGAALLATHILVSGYIAWDTYTTGLRVDRAAEAERDGLRPPFPPGEARLPAP